MTANGEGRRGKMCSRKAVPKMRTPKNIEAKLSQDTFWWADQCRPTKSPTDSLSFGTTNHHHHTVSSLQCMHNKSGVMLAAHGAGNRCINKYI